MSAEEEGVDVRVLKRENLWVWGRFEGESMRLIGYFAIDFEVLLGF